MKSCLWIIFLFFTLNCLGQSAQDYFYAGKTKFENNSPVKAILDFDKSISLNPKFADAFFYRALAKSEISDFKAAIIDLTMAIELNPFNSDYFCLRGNYKSELKDNLGAVIDFTKAVEVFPSNRNSPLFDLVYILIGRSLSKYLLTDFRGVISDCNNAIALKANCGEAYLYRGFAKFDLGEKNDACLDLSRAGELGEAKAYDAIQKICR